MKIRTNTCARGHEVKVLKSNAYYIGTTDEEGAPWCRLSQEYYPTKELAQEALNNRTFTPRTEAIEIAMCRGNATQCLSMIKEG